MRVNRRQFIVAGLGGVAVGCHHNGDASGRTALGSTEAAPEFSLDPTVPWLSIQFRGLIGLVDDSNGGLTALMVDAKGADAMLQPHVSRLITDQGNYDSAHSASPDGIPVDPLTDQKSATLVYWDVAGYNVTFPGEPGRKIVRAKTVAKRTGNELLPSLLNIADVSWIPQMSRLTATGKSRVRAECLGPNPQSANVAARVRVGSGELTAIFPPNRSGRYDQVAFEFINPPPPLGAYRQALGMSRVIQQLPSGTRTVTLEPFDSTKPTKTIVLTRTQELGDPLEVQISNEIPPGTAGYKKCTTNDQILVLDHFAALYTLLDPRDQSDVKPIPHAINLEPTTGAVLPHCSSYNEIIWCPGGDFSG
jgi:hypothetical protein